MRHGTDNGRRESLELQESVAGGLPGPSCGLESSPVWEDGDPLPPALQEEDTCRPDWLNLELRHSTVGTASSCSLPITASCG